MGSRQSHSPVMEAKSKIVDSIPNQPTEQRTQKFLEFLEEISTFFHDPCNKKHRPLILAKVQDIVNWRYDMPDADRNVAFRTASLIKEERYDHDYSGFGNFDKRDTNGGSATDGHQETPRKRKLSALDAEADSSNADHQRPRKKKNPRSATDASCGIYDGTPDKLPDAYDVDITADAYRVKGCFLSLWINGHQEIYEELEEFLKKRNLQCKKLPPGTDRQHVEWGDFDLYTTKNIPGLQQCKNIAGLLPDNADRFRTSKRISSQLLLYRLVAIFGPPPLSEWDDIDDYKMTWRYTLYSIDDIKDENIEEKDISRIIFMDWKGWWEVRYDGDEAFEKTAIRLIEWLCSDNVPHPYDYTVAGNHA